MIKNAGVNWQRFLKMLARKELKAWQLDHVKIPIN